MQRINRLRKRKLFVCFCVLQKLLLALLFFLPLTRTAGGLEQGLLLGGYFLAQVWSQIATPATQDWIASLVPMKERGSYFSRKDAVAVFVTVTLMLGMGVVMDVCSGPKQLLGFFINGSLILFLVLLNFGAFSCMKEPRMGETNPEGREIHCRPSRKGSDKEQSAAKAKKKNRNIRWKEGTAMNICRVGQNGNMLVSSRFFFSCMARFFAGLFFDVFFGFFFMQSRRLEQLQPA